MNEKRLAGKVALVTGGGTGIGRATSLRLAAEGAAVAVNYSVSKAEADQTVAELSKLGAKAVAVQADVSDLAAVQRMFTETEKTLGPVSILVCSAGRTNYIRMADLDAVEEETWDAIMAVNVKGAFFCAREAAAQMRRSGVGGIIVFVASIAGVTGRGSCIPYSVSKGAMITLAKSLAIALAPHIRVNAVAPGVVVSRWTEGHDEHKRVSLEETPMGRNATVDDVAEVVLSFVTSAGFVTGQALIIDGGRTL
jgi:3-oxoacyl-[acyl-carrier protein] reductase